MKITTKQYQSLTDQQLIWDLMVSCYQPLCTNGVAAPFFEYAITASWMDTRFLYLNRIWMDGEKAVGFVFYENPVSSIFFHLLPGYECLAEEMMDYAIQHMPGKDAKELNLFPGQKALIEAAERRGWQLQYTSQDMLFDFQQGVLDYPLPEGFHFVEPLDIDPVKLARCTWKGFDHEDKGPFINWDEEDPGTPWNPQKAYLDVISSLMAPPPHATFDRIVVIADAQGEYACYSGMWWVPENCLAYMEPLCTIPKHRHKGLAAAALSRHYRNLSPLGAQYMTGGEDPFYQKIGYTKAIQWLHYKKAAK
ncbi:MAG: hypothetical protein IJD39_05980 [Clostridia bacterium]|nr:hypothetical protein [Clostridia bacterium]